VLCFNRSGGLIYAGLHFVSQTKSGVLCICVKTFFPVNYLNFSFTSVSDNTSERSQRVLCFTWIFFVCKRNICNFRRGTMRCDEPMRCKWLQIGLISDQTKFLHNLKTA